MKKEVVIVFLLASFVCINGTGGPTEGLENLGNRDNSCVGCLSSLKRWASSGWLHFKKSPHYKSVQKDIVDLQGSVKGCCVKVFCCGKKGKKQD